MLVIKNTPGLALPERHSETGDTTVTCKHPCLKEFLFDPSGKLIFLGRYEECRIYASLEELDKIIIFI